MTHICVGKLTIIGSNNGLSPGRRQAIILTNAGILLIGPLGTKFSEILIGIYTFSFKKMHLKMSAKWRLFCLGLNVSMHQEAIICIDKTRNLPSNCLQTAKHFTMLNQQNAQCCLQNHICILQASFDHQLFRIRFLWSESMVKEDVRSSQLSWWSAD